MFNKPGGCITARHDPRHKTVMDYFPEADRNILFPVGRLDKDTEGLLLVTDDGELTFKLLSPSYSKEKTYFFYAKGIPDPEKIKELSTGIHIYRDSDFTTAPAVINITENTTLGEIKDYLSEEDRSLAKKKPDLKAIGGYITITEGKKHQVKRMIRYSGPKVVYLKRVKMDSLTLDPTLGKGKYRPLTKEELEQLKM